MRQMGRNTDVSSRFGLSRPSQPRFGLALSCVTICRYFFLAALVFLASPRLPTVGKARTCVLLAATHFQRPV